MQAFVVSLRGESMYRATENSRSAVALITCNSDLRRSEAKNEVIKKSGKNSWI